MSRIWLLRWMENETIRHPHQSRGHSWWPFFGLCPVFTARNVKHSVQNGRRWYCSVKIVELRVRCTSLERRFPLFSNYTLVFSSHNDAANVASGLIALTSLDDVAIYFVSSGVDFVMTCNSFFALRVTKPQQVFSRMFHAFTSNFVYCLIWVFFL